MKNFKHPEMLNFIMSCILITIFYQQHFIILGISHLYPYIHLLYDPILTN